MDSEKIQLTLKILRRKIMKFQKDAFEQLERRGFIFQATHLEETSWLMVK